MQRDVVAVALRWIPARNGVRCGVSKLKERLGTPVAYHVYNWHEIPFNIGYPHFLPARKTAREGLVSEECSAYTQEDERVL